jgi:hypothetical protein
VFIECKHRYFLNVKVLKGDINRHSPVFLNRFSRSLSSGEEIFANAGRDVVWLILIVVASVNVASKSEVSVVIVANELENGVARKF